MSLNYGKLFSSHCLFSILLIKKNLNVSATEFYIPSLHETIKPNIISFNVLFDFTCKVIVNIKKTLTLKVFVLHKMLLSHCYWLFNSKSLRFFKSDVQMNN